MTRARAKNSASSSSPTRLSYLTLRSTDPDQFSSIPFHAKALKILLHDVQRSGDDATIGKKGGEMEDFNDLDSDDGVCLCFSSLV